jgi:hypothetical protein
MADALNARERLAELCRVFAARTGDGRLRTAAAILSGKKPGRRPIDDEKALAYVATLLKTGIAESEHDACERAAIVYAPAHQVETMRDRLRRKFRTQPIKSGKAT